MARAEAIVTEDMLKKWTSLRICQEDGRLDRILERAGLAERLMCQRCVELMAPAVFAFLFNRAQTGEHLITRQAGVSRWSGLVCELTKRRLLAAWGLCFAGRYGHDLVFEAPDGQKLFAHRWVLRLRGAKASFLLPGEQRSNDGDSVIDAQQPVAAHQTCVAVVRALYHMGTGRPDADALALCSAEAAFLAFLKFDISLYVSWVAPRMSFRNRLRWLVGAPIDSSRLRACMSGDLTGGEEIHCCVCVRERES
jgi:hypothetical protein